MLEALDPTKVQKLKDKLSDLIPKSTPLPPQEDLSAFDPEGYDIDPAVAHLYARAKWEMVDGERRLATPAIDTMCVSRFHNGRGFYPDKKDNGQAHPLAGQAKGLADAITQLENSSEGWKLFAVVADGAGQGAAYLRRLQKLILTEPKRTTEATTEVAPTDVEARAKEWEAAQRSA